MVKNLEAWGYLRKPRSRCVQFSGNSMCVMVETVYRAGGKELKGSQVYWAIRETQGRDGHSTEGGPWAVTLDHDVSHG